MQKRVQSLIETVASTAIGFIIAFLAQLIFYPLYGFEVTLSQNLQLTAIFTAISIVRGYYVRCLFNHLHRTQHLGQDAKAS